MSFIEVETLNGKIKVQEGVLNIVENAANKSMTIEIEGYFHRWGVSAKDIKRRVKNFNPTNIQINVSGSLGGSVNESTLIGDYLAEHRASIDIKYSGYNASAATHLVFCTTKDRVKISKSSYFLIHNPIMGTNGDKTAHKSSYQHLLELEDRLENEYSRISSLTKQEVSDLMDENRWMSAKEVVEKKFIENLYDPLKEGSQNSIDLVPSNEFLEEIGLPQITTNMIPDNGSKLAAHLNKLISAKETDKMKRADIVAGMAQAAGISTGTVNQILQAKINCPPINRLEGFAKYFKVSRKSIVDIANQDGCKYDAKNNLMSEQKNEQSFYKMVKNFFKGEEEQDNSDPKEKVKTQEEKDNSQIQNLQNQFDSFKLKTDTEILNLKEKIEIKNKRIKELEEDPADEHTPAGGGDPENQELDTEEEGTIYQTLLDTPDKELDIVDLKAKNILKSKELAKEAGL